MLLIGSKLLKQDTLPEDEFTTHAVLMCQPLTSSHVLRRRRHDVIATVEHLVVVTETILRRHKKSIIVVDIGTQCSYCQIFISASKPQQIFIKLQCI